MPGKLSTATTTLALPGVALVTGGASGLGESTVLALADLGAKVVVADINVQLGEEVFEARNIRFGNTLTTLSIQLVALINGTYPKSAIFVKTNVTDEEEVKNAVKVTVETFGRLDYAVNSAGIVVGGPAVTEIKNTPISEYERIQNVDARGVFLCMKYQLLQMESQDIPSRPRASRGVIVNLASRASLEGVAKFGSYCSAKHAVLGMSRVAAVESAKSNIRVIAMAPGLISTPGHVKAAKEVDDFLLSTVPMGRYGVPDEIADGITFLCSDMASYISGTIFEIDGACAAR